jgi:hypothetical protein
LLILVYAGLRLGLWKTLAESLLGGWAVAELPAEDDAQAPGGGVDAPPDQVRHSNQEINVAEERKSCSNSMELVARLLSNRLRFRLLNVLRLTVGPVREYFGRDMSRSKTIMGQKELLLDWAEAKWHATCYGQVFWTMQDEATLKLGHFLGVDEENLLEAEIKDESLVANKMCSLAVALVGARIGDMMMWTRSIPGSLVLLLHDNPEVKATTLKRLKGLWEWILMAEQAAERDPWVAEVLDDLQLTTWIWVREVFMMMED